MKPDTQVRSGRWFPAPPERVFRAWTAAGELSRWWGPAGFRNSFQEFRPEPGGDWRYVMHGPDGADYPNHCVFEAVEPPRRLVFDHLSGHRYRAELRLEAERGGTRLDWRMDFEDAAEFGRIRDFIRAANEENLDRLQALLAGEP